MSLSLKKRFEVFKRDNFTCRYCGGKSPKVILEVDHIIPISKGGDDDSINLATSCFECNRGKGARNLSEIITGEDPHDKAIELAERERQLREYNEIRMAVEVRIKKDVKKIFKNLSLQNINLKEEWGRPTENLLEKESVIDVQKAIEIALEKGKYWPEEAMPYCRGILRNWREENGR